jgi:hypothetical protein
MVPVGACSCDGATQAFAVGDGVPVTSPAVEVTSGVAVGLGDGFGVDPQAVATNAKPASAARRR